MMFDPPIFCCLYVGESQDLQSSNFNSIDVPTKGDLRDFLLGKAQRENRRPPTVVRNHNGPNIYVGKLEVETEVRWERRYSRWKEKRIFL